MRDVTTIRNWEAFQKERVEDLRRKMSVAEIDYEELKSLPLEKRLKLPIAMIGPSTRIVQALGRCGINTVGQALRMRKQEILEVPSFGEQSLKELIECIAKIGIKGPANSGRPVRQCIRKKK